MTEKMRLDVLLVERGLAPSRERAQALIMSGTVLVAGEAHSKAGEAVPIDAPIELAETLLPYVSRGGLKLRKALDEFPVDPSGQVCLDVGASTGGFTDCLLQAGALRVYSVDVGYGQLDWKLRNDPRVVNIEKTNIRYLTELPETPTLAVIDVAFISLTKVLEPTSRLMGFQPNTTEPEPSESAPGTQHPALTVIALVKPQFEAGPGKAPKGVVRDPETRRQVLSKVVAYARQLGWRARGLTESPITGPAGNHEFLLWLSSEGGDAVDEEAIARCVRP